MLAVLKVITLLFLSISASHGDISPSMGSLGGGTRVTISGSGFSMDSFGSLNAQSSKGNVVQLTASNPTKVLSCTAVPYSSNTEQIVCVTDNSGHISGNHVYSVYISSDGGSFSYSGSFAYRSDQTPLISDASPRYTKPGVRFSMSGRIYTAKYEDTDEEQTGQEQIERVYLGPSVCHLYDSDSQNGTLFGLAVDENDMGYTVCEPNSTDIGSFNATWLFSGPKGRSVIIPDALLVSAQLRAFLVQQYSVMTGISPTTGSREGNTLIRVYGEYFHESVDHVKVFVGERECEVVTAGLDEITCKSPKQGETTSVYPGQRGWSVHVWYQSVGSVEAIATLDVALSNTHYVDLVSDLPSMSGGDYAVKVSGYFLAPQSGRYTFTTSSGLLYMRTTGYPNTSAVSTACSGVCTLEKGELYYLYALDTNSVPVVSVRLFESEFVNARLGLARNERQRVSTTNSPFDEKQRVEVLSRNEGKYSIQSVTLPRELVEVCCVVSQLVNTSCNINSSNSTGMCNVTCSSTSNSTNSTDECNVTSEWVNSTECHSSLVNILYRGNASSLLLNASSLRIEEELNVRNDAVIESGGVNVSVGGNLTHLTWVFTYKEIGVREVIGLEVSEFDCAREETVNRSVPTVVVTEGVEADVNFTLVFGGVKSVPIPFTASTSQIRESIEALFIRKCEYPTGTKYLLQDYEIGTGYYVSGVLNGTVEPYCGQKSVRNPYHIFQASSTYLRKNGGSLEKSEEFDARVYKHLCFAYIGAINPNIYIGVKWQNQSLDTISSSVIISQEKFTPHVSSWSFQCENIFSKLEQSDIFQDIYSESGYSITSITLYKSSTELLVDEVSFAEGEIFVSRSLDDPARPNGIFVDSCAIERHIPQSVNTSLSVDVTCTTFGCGHNFTLIEVAYNEFHSNKTRFNITRLQHASPPIQGNFTLTKGGVLTRAIDVQSTREELEGILEETFLEGEMSVSRSGDCRGYTWTAEWVQMGGDKDQMVLDYSNVELFGEGSMAVSTLREGGLYLPFLPPDMLRSSHSLPQVSVMVNDVPAACNGECSFEHSSASTPTITSISPQSGREGGVVSLTGTGFGTQSTGVYVLVGGVNCSDVMWGSSVVTCVVPLHVCGVLPVKVHIPGYGFSTGFSFSYLMTVHSSNNVSLSTSGGTHLLMTGDSFGNSLEDVSVEINSRKCVVLGVSNTQIVCESPANPAGPYAVDISIRNVTDSSFQVNYTITASPNISSVQPDRFGACGGVITIYGSNFYNDVRIHIGEVYCVNVSIEDSGNRIVCTVPPHPPGDVILTVTHLEYGSSSHPISYEFSVSSVSPSVVSPLGGSVLTLTGLGFCSEISITFPFSVCRLLFINATRLECRIGWTGREHSIDNSGYSSELGHGYNWHPNSVSIQPGDRVTWSWVGSQLIAYQVVETDADGKDVVGGFSSGVSTSGNFSHCFYVPGVYYYRSLVSSMKGVVNVSELSSFVSDISMSVQQNISPSSVPSLPVNVTATPIDPSCEIPLPIVPVSVGAMQLIFWRCKSGSVSSVTPSEGHWGDVIIVSGSHFLNHSILLLLNYEYPCEVFQQNDTTALCRLNMSYEVPTCLQLAVSVAFGNDGYALLPRKTEYYLKPTVTEMSPRIGSVEGCTIVTISGYGLNEVTRLNLGSECEILSQSYQEITCRTSANIAGLFPLNISYCSFVESSSFEFEYSHSHTPQVTQVSSVEGLLETMISIDGIVTNDSSAISVSVGEYVCAGIQVSANRITCNVSAPILGDYPVSVSLRDLGCAAIPVHSQTVSIAGSITEFSPLSGSTGGCTLLTINGHGFSPDTTVSIGTDPCDTIAISYNTVTCSTRQSAGTNLVRVSGNGKTITSMATFVFSSSSTPTIASLSPSSGTGGELVLSGSNLGTTSDNVTVVFGSTVECSILNVEGSSIRCHLPSSLTAGSYTPLVSNSVYGCSVTAQSYTFQLQVDDNTYNSGIRGRDIELTGHGFDPANTIVTVCDIACAIYLTQSFPEYLRCRAPPHSTDQTCNIQVTVNPSVVLLDAFHYNTSLSSNVTGIDPVRGGTGGGVLLTITGIGFGNVREDIIVRLGQLTCNVSSVVDTEIECFTPSSEQSIEVLVEVHIESKGYAESSEKFEFIDVWSSVYTWGGTSLPVAGDFVVISPNQTILLDISTPTLSFLLIQGKLVFDEADIELNSESILVTDGGVLQVGTEAEHFQHNAVIRIHGHARKPELPVYGTKVLAVRDGTLELHGKPIPITWSRLSRTANVNDTEITIEHEVNWSVGDEIVIATTGFGPVGNERVRISSVVVENGLTRLGINPALQFDHLSVEMWNGEKDLHLKAEVGLLTRNIVFEGSVNDEWTEQISACPRDFNHDQHATQSCFQGRFGEEIGSDEFGAHIMIHSPIDEAEARIEYVEVRHAGQAFRLGRYPIHYHLNGNVSHSYVRGCAIHDTFNRAVTIHAVHNLLVEHNVAYNVKGHAFFLEDGIETGNVIRYNLAVFVRSSSSLLNVDVTPAAFWITNPDNVVSHNAAAGGTTFGYWVRLSAHPEGPSFTSSVCPRHVVMREFTNNSAHSFGRYGLWIFPNYAPKLHGSCESTVPTAAVFSNFLTWHNLRGAESVETGAVHWRDFNAVSNVLAGLEVTIPSVWHTESEDGGLVSNSFVSSRITGLEEHLCGSVGVRSGHNRGSTFVNMTFANFDKSFCSAIAGCSHCKPRQGGWEVRWSGVRFLNTTNRVSFLWEHETVHADMDGSITGSGNGSYNIVPTMGLLPLSNCFLNVIELSVGDNPGSSCWNVSFRRMAWNNPKPESLLYVNAILSNDYGSSVVPFKFKRLTHSNGWMALLLVDSITTLLFQNVTHVTNISYNAGFFEIAPEDDLWIRHPFTQRPDYFRILEDTDTHSLLDIPRRPNATHGDWHFNDSSLNLYYFVSGNGLTNSIDRETKLSIFQCFFPSCVIPVPPPPPMGRPTEFKRWSVPSDWIDETYGISEPPVDGDDVLIPPGWWMVIDTELPTIRNLTIQGVLEFEDYINYVLNATYIVILGENAGLIAGLNGSFQHNIRIRLLGDHDTPELVYPGNAPVIGAKVIANFGILQLRGKVPQVSWTFANATILQNHTTLLLTEQVDWRVNSEILITSTSYDHYETEVAIISYIELDKVTCYVTTPFKHTHRVVRGVTDNGLEYVMRPEVALLDRNIIIEGVDEPSGSVSSRDFGARVISSTISYNDKTLIATTFLEAVQFLHGGQYGHSGSDDPRYALSFLNLGSPLRNSSFVRSCVFYDSRSPAIGVFRSHAIEVSDNVVYGTIGDSVIIEADGINLTHNLAVQTKFPEYFLTTVTEGLLPHVVTFELARANNLKLRDNSAAGSDYIGYHTDGEHCDEVDPDREWSGNIAHSNLHGINMLYDDGQPGCSKVSKFTCYLNWDWGVFTYTRQRMRFQDLILIDNRVGLHAIVYEPRSLDHVCSDKYVSVSDSLFVGNSDVGNCRDLSSRPRHEARTSFWKAGVAKNGGNVGFTLATFMSERGTVPNKPYDTLLSYSTISGVTRMDGVTFANFVDACDDKAIQSHKKSGDAMHPVEIRNSFRSNVDENATYFVFRPLLSWVDPSDCVDMDCDGPKKVLIKLLDDSFLGKTGELVAQSEFEWNGDSRRGLGDYRIPLALQTNDDGSRVNISETFPNKGIYRDADCVYDSDWQSYFCPGSTHEMMVIESLDADTETRRISPVGLAANGFIDLINGPMDHGWCLGYTCQERISTFYTIVRVGLNYSVAFTGTNPQVLRFFMLNADVSRGIVVGLFYPNPQRLDVYNGENYIVPTNAMLSTDRLIYTDTRDPDIRDAHIPSVDLNPGANFFDRSRLMMFFVVKGNAKIKLETTMVIQLRFDVASITVDAFFEEKIVSNIANLLGIPESRIRVTNIVGIPRMLRRQVEHIFSNVSIQIEIGDPPQNMTFTPIVDTYTYVPPSPPATNLTNQTDPTMMSMSNVTNTSSLSYNDLLNISSTIVDVTQSGELGGAINANIDTLIIADPLPTPEAANFTGLNDSALNNTYLESLPIFVTANGSSIDFSLYKVPENLILYQGPLDANETVPFGQQPLFYVTDENDNIVTDLRHLTNEPWQLTVSFRAGFGHPDAYFLGNTTIPFVAGWANFSDLAISHAGLYILDFTVTSPLTNLSVASEMFEVRERVIVLNILEHVDASNETILFSPAPLIELVDIGIGQRVRNHDWKGWDWVTEVILTRHSGNGSLLGETKRNFTLGLVGFPGLAIHSEGNYSVEYSVYTVPASNYSLGVVFSFVVIRERRFYLTLETQPNDCNETVVCGNWPMLSIRDEANGEVVSNLGWRNRTWGVNAYLLTSNDEPFQLNGTSEYELDELGVAVFDDLRVFTTGVGFYLVLNISTEADSNYDGLSIVSNGFEVKERVYYLSVDSVPSDCNQSVVCGVSPSVGVYDYGTGMIAPYLNASWEIYVYIQFDNSLRDPEILGYNRTRMVNSIATFHNFSLSEYAGSFTLLFESNFGHFVISDAFEVHYVNDYSPVFQLPTSLSISLFEENTTNITISSFYAVDLDEGSQGDVSYSISTLNVGTLFSIDEVNGNLSLLSSLDREMFTDSSNAPRYVLTIRASDLAYPEKVRYTELIYTVNILDINDNPPLFSYSNYIITCREDLRTGENCFTRIASDKDEGINSQIIYSLVAIGQDYEIFLIDPTNARLNIKNETLLDFDNMTLPNGSYYEYFLIATDMGVPPMSSNTTYKITIIPVNEFPPVFLPLAQYSFEFAEENNTTLSVTTVFAADADFGEEGVVHYRLAGFTDIFSIGLVDGVINVTGRLDYEQATHYDLVVEAFDFATSSPAAGLPGPFLTNLNLLINLTDINDNAPQFADPNGSFQLAETEALYTIVYTVTAWDIDSGLNGELSFAITQLVPANNITYFVVNEENGGIHLNYSLDLDLIEAPIQEIVLLVTVTDKGTPAQRNETNLTILISQMDEFPPSFLHGDINVEIAENQPLSQILFDVNATDPDFGLGGEFVFVKSGTPDDSFFTLNPESGIVLGAIEFDRETKDSYSWIVVVETKATNLVYRSSTVNVLVIILDENDNPPMFQLAVNKFSFPETKPANTELYQITATDRDINLNANLHYSLHHVNSAANVFSIDELTGLITVREDLNLESPAVPLPADETFNLTITAFDRSDAPKFANTTVLLQVTGVNEFAPIFSNTSGQVLPFAENISISSVLFKVSATDMDFGPQGVLSYSFISGNDEGRFSIDSATGTVRLISELDRELRDSYDLVMIALDSDPVSISRLNDTLSLRIIVEDVNDNAPLLYPVTSCAVSVAENSMINSSLFSLSASDADLPPNSDIEFFSTMTAVPFSIDSLTGNVSLTGAIDYENIVSYNLHLFARDKGAPSITSNPLICPIQIVGVNEFPPVFTSNNYSFSVVENSPVNREFGHVSAPDGDSGLDGEVIYSVSGDNRFTINEHGSVLVFGFLDREIDTSPIILNVSAVDSPGGSVRFTSYTLVTVTVEDLNDNPPIFVQNSQYISIPEDTAIGVSVAEFMSSDRDLGSNGEVRYSISSAAFAINASTGVVSVHSVLNRETKSSYDLTVIASDQASQNQMSSLATLTVNLEDVNDNPPNFSQLNYSFMLPQPTSANMIILTVSASDLDIGTNGQVFYSIVSQSDNFFAIEPSNGTIILEQILPCSNEQYFLTISATRELSRSV